MSDFIAGCSDCHFVSGSKCSLSCTCLMKSGRTVIKISMHYCQSNSKSTEGRRQMSEWVHVSARNAQKGSGMACAQRCHLSRLSCTDCRLRLMGPLSSPCRCIVLQQAAVAMVSCVCVMKSGPGEGYQPLQEDRKRARERKRESRQAPATDLYSRIWETLEFSINLFGNSGAAALALSSTLP